MLSKKCLTRVSHKSVKQECLTRALRNSVKQGCPTKVSPQCVKSGCLTTEFVGNVTNKYCLCLSTNVSAFGFVGFILFFFSVFPKISHCQKVIFTAQTATKKSRYQNCFHFGAITARKRTTTKHQVGHKKTKIQQLTTYHHNPSGAGSNFGRRSFPTPKMEVDFHHFVREQNQTKPLIFAENLEHRDN